MKKLLNSKKNLPYSLIAEKMIIKSFLLETNVMQFLSQKLTVEAFYFKDYQNLYKIGLTIFSQKQEVSFLTIISFMQDRNVKNINYYLKLLNQLIEEPINLLNINEYVNLINEKYLRRLLIKLGSDITNFGYQTNLKLDIIFEKIESKFYAIKKKQEITTLYGSSEILLNILLELKSKNQKSSVSGFLSQFHDLNAITQGFQKSDLIIIAGRPAMGKTAFALNVVHHVLNLYSVPVIFFSLEMTKKQLLYRLISMETEINNTRLKLGNLTKTDWKKLSKITNKIAKFELYIDDSSNLTLFELKKKIEKIKLKFKTIGPIIIDYLQLLQITNKISTNRTQEISNITRALKITAREFDVPIIVLSQLSRNLESRVNKRPTLADLRDSGCISKETLNLSILKKESQLSQFLNLNYFLILTFRENKILKNSNFIIRFTGLKPIYNTITKLGLSISLTSNHKIKIEENWLRLDNIKSNVKIKINLSGNNYNYFFKIKISENLKQIKYVGLQKTYDITLKNSKNFLANNIIIHNSIEQDADVVLMLYRENYYNKFEKNNLSELIIAKHRTGPTGTIKLIFDSNSTKFYNFKT